MARVRFTVTFRVRVRFMVRAVAKPRAVLVLVLG